MQTLADIIIARVHPKSVIHTDSWKGYENLKNYFIHYKVNYSLHYVDPLTGIHTKSIEGNWAPLKNILAISGEQRKIFGYHWQLQ
ncbi:hypothetical protein EHP00_1887 [Ecytonucleospora hepatopenaei]|uniref:ISXO2-like transposase domain-containing protein n=1 Tax=Ecytonucleospora hepatopenaei TaxID=646526 RepID=A0A1W0E2Y0_9MICR|nr:hypothetical protein EHP00_1887 [Ecytonucleospora hepatopenaei]